MTTQTNSATKIAISFQMHAVKKAGVTAKVFYSLSDDHITIYAKDYGDALGRVFSGVEGCKAVNDSDSMTDYICHTHVVLTNTHPLFAAAKEAHDRTKAAQADRRAKKLDRLATSKAEQERAEARAQVNALLGF